MHDSELEHVSDLTMLHDRHFVPYHAFVMGLTASAGNETDCEALLRQRLGERDKQAAGAFALGDAAETKKLDERTSTHFSDLPAVIGPGCTSATITAKQRNPQRPGAGPGNVRKVAPQVTPIDPTKLSVVGTALMSGTTRLRNFASAADANSAMTALATFGITESQRIGPFELLLANGQTPVGGLMGVAGLDIDSAAYQVAIGGPTATDWVISEMKGQQMFEIVNFGAQRDQAYSAVALMRQHGVTR